MSASDAITNDEDVIDSRDVIDRIEYLEDLFRSMADELEEAGWKFEHFTEDLWHAKKGDTVLYCESMWNAIAQANIVQNPSEPMWVDESAELRHLKALADEAEGYGDWEYGEQLIREDHFQDYIGELIDDAYPMPKEMKSGSWPWRHLKLDIEAAAQEAKIDYMEVEFNGQSYFMRA